MTAELTVDVAGRRRNCLGQKSRMRHVAAVVAFACVASAAACSSDSDGSDASSTTSSADLSYVDAQIQKYSAVPEFDAPGLEIDPEKLAGKTVFNFPDSSANPYAANIAAGEEVAATSIPGLSYVNCTAQGQLTQWVQCMNDAISRDVDLIFNFSGVNPKSIGPQLEQARQAGIPVVGTGVYDVSEELVALPHSVPNDYGLAGRLMADWVVHDTRGDAHALVITSNEVPATTPIVTAIKNEFSERCGDGCSATYVNVPVADWGTKIQFEVQSALLRDPKINYIVPIYDSMTQFALAGINSTGRVRSVHIATYNGTPAVLQEMQDGDVVRMDVGVSEDWLGWAYMDAALRVMVGDAAQTINENTPVRVFTKDNVEEAGTPPQLSTGYGDDYVAGYRSLWGAD